MVTTDSRLDTLENTAKRLQQQVSNNAVKLEACCDLLNELVNRVQRVEARDLAPLQDALARLKELEKQVSDSMGEPVVAGVPVIVMED